MNEDFNTMIDECGYVVLADVFSGSEVAGFTVEEIIKAVEEGNQYREMWEDLQTHLISLSARLENYHVVDEILKYMEEL